MVSKKRGLAMQRKSLITMIAVFMGIFYMTGLSFAAEEKKEEMKMFNKIITISTYEGIKPTTVTSKPGTTVIWVNYSRTPVEILFLEKKVVLACGSPINFFVGKDGAYESAKIPFGGTASLCFMEKGKYEYVFKTSSTFYPLVEKEHRGMILIK